MQVREERYKFFKKLGRQSQHSSYHASRTLQAEGFTSSIDKLHSTHKLPSEEVDLKEREHIGRK